MLKFQVQLQIVLIQFNSIQDYLYSAFHDKIIAKAAFKADLQC